MKHYTSCMRTALNIFFQSRTIVSASPYSKQLKSLRGKAIYGGKRAKVVVIRRNFLPSGEGPVVKEWKHASSVIKQLNWENKQLFGPLQTSPKSSYNQDKFKESNQIIQHATQIPIVEPPLLENTPLSVDLEPILEFPLVNRPEAFSEHVSNRIERCNRLRKSLEKLRGSASAPSVSSILEKTMPPERVEILERWRQNMITQLGEEGFQQYQKEIFAKGSSLHDSINAYLSSASQEDFVIKDENFGHWKSLKGVLPAVSEVKLLEEPVFHPFLYYRGVVDCFAKYKDQLVVIDWKTSKKSKLTLKSLYDNPLQVAAYVGALNFDQKYQYLANKGVVVVAYDSGVPASVHFIDEAALREYWKQWLQRVKAFYEALT